MKRKNLYLAGAILEFARFAALSSIVRAVLSPSVSDGGSLLYQAMAFPQLFCAPAFFFLWRDRSAYDRYRPLIAFAKIAGAIAFAPFVIGSARAVLLGSGSVTDRPVQLAVLLAVLSYDAAFAAICLVADPVGAASPVEGIPSDGAAPAAGADVSAEGGRSTES
ncbi:MAG: hypothetical protein NT080_03140 [Spirochaetes bacterium]|nr:hypothetical protein [Spirochaetota bacterium]